MKNKNQTAKGKRGYTTEAENNPFISKSDNELIYLLKSNNPKERTSAAIILGQKKAKKAISTLCEQLKNEKALYSKIAISEALGEIGKPAIDELIKYLGKIGTNQHKALPKNIFNKWSYPLPRDIIARTICKIGNSVLADLNKVLAKGNKKQIYEAVDAIGFISFYSEDRTSFEILEKLLQKYNDDEILKWKITRALSAFPSKESEKVLLNMLKTSKGPELKWEAIRSLGLICKKVPEELLIAKNDENNNIRKMFFFAIDKISGNN
ncbi:MAG: HEAT repeat domain-containing protein [bacterium]